MSTAFRARNLGAWIIAVLVMLGTRQARADLDSYLDLVLDMEGLVDHYSFESNLIDSADGGNGANDGTPNGAESYADGVDGQGDSVVFGGANWVTIDRSLQGDFTIMGWMLAPEIQTNLGAQFYLGAGLVYADVPGGANDYGLSVNGTKLGHGIGNPDTTLFSGRDVAGPDSCDWVHFAAVRRVVGAASQVEIWIDGELDASGTAPNGAALTASATLTLGSNAVDNRTFVGQLDEVSLFGTALDGESIEAAYDAFARVPVGCADPDASCDGLVVEGPAGDKAGEYTVTASGSDGTGDPIRYTFRATHSDGTQLSVGPQDLDTASFFIDKAGEWTFSVLVDDDPCCPDAAEQTCSETRTIAAFEYTDANGRLRGTAFLVLGPFAQARGANPPLDVMLRNYIAPSRIDCSYPEEGEEIDYDPARAESTAYVGPGDVPTWRAFDDGTADDGDQDLNADVGAQNNVMSWMVTYIEYTGAGPIDIDVCLGSDDSGQVWIDGENVINDSAARGRGDCDATAVVTITPGVHRFAAAAWQGGGGWGLRLSIQEQGVGAIVDDADLFPEWDFHGPNRPAGFVPPECSSCDPEPVRITRCELQEGVLFEQVVLEWENPERTDNAVPTEILANGELITTVASTATTATIRRPDGFFTIDVVHCGGVPATCTPLKTEPGGRLLGSAFLAVGPFTHTHGCGGPVEDLEGNHLAPSHIGCLYPEEGDQIEYDPLDPAAASTSYIGPVGDLDLPLVRAFDDGSAADGDQDLNADVQGPQNNVVTWLITYVEYAGAGSTTLQFCFGSDDGGQIWFDDRLVHTSNNCRGRGDCQDSATIDIEPGVHRLAFAAWNAGGGWGLTASLLDEAGTPIADDGTRDDWIFHGRTRPAGDYPCGLRAPVVIATCERAANGDVTVEWVHDEPTDELQILANGEIVAELAPNATSVTLAANDLPNTDPLKLCVANGAQPPACCFVAPLPALVNHYTFDETLEDEEGTNDGIFFGDPESLEPNWVDGFDGEELGAILFDGIDDYVQVNREIASEFTIAAWLRAEATQIGNDTAQFYQGSGFVYADVPGGANDFGAAVTGNVFAFGIGNPDQTVHSLSPVTTGEWTHVAATRTIDRDLGVSILRVWVNGVLDGELEHPNTSPLDAQALITIGGNVIDNRYFSGEIDDVRIYNYPLDEDEIEELAEGGGGGDGERFLRGDADASGAINITDGIFVLNFLFLGGSAPTCRDAADADDSGAINITDGIYVLNFLFLGGASPLPPHPRCGTDPQGDGDGLACSETQPGCV